MAAAAEEQAKEFAAAQGDIRQQHIQQQQEQQQQQQQIQMQMANNQLRYHQMQQAKNGSNNLTQNPAHFRHPQHGTQLVPPQPS